MDDGSSWVLMGPHGSSWVLLGPLKGYKKKRRESALVALLPLHFPTHLHLHPHADYSVPFVLQ